MRTSLFVLGGLLLAPSVSPQSPPSIYQRPTGVTALITGSPKLRDGAYQASGRSSICGFLPKLAPLTDEAFVIEFPSETPRQSPGDVTSISFGSKEFSSGKDGKTTRFTLNIAVVTAAGGQPPAFVLNTDPPRPGITGVATLTRIPGGGLRLAVGGKEEAGETITLNVTCS